MRIAYRLAGYDRQTERLIGSHEIRADLVSAIRRIAQIPASDDGCGDYPLNAEQTHKLAKKLGIAVHPEIFDYLIEPFMKSPRFLTEREVAGEFRDMLQGPGPHRLAVAFWGENAADILGLIEDCPPVEIACNLTSGGTNPAAIRKILQSGAKHIVRSNPKLHAKVYLSGRSAIIGSSNASANGLALQGHELDGWQEANVIVTDSELVGESHGWFERIWKSSIPVQLGDDLLKTADLAWQKARDRDRRAAPRERRSLLEAIRNGVKEVLDLPIRFVIFVTGDNRRWPEEAIRKIKADPNDEIQAEAIESDISYWINWPELLPGTYYINYDSKGLWLGIWKTPAVNHVRQLRYDRSITVCYECKDIEGFTISDSEKRRLGRLLVKLIHNTKAGMDDFSLSDIQGELWKMTADTAGVRAQRR